MIQNMEKIIGKIGAGVAVVCFWVGVICATGDGETILPNILGLVLMYIGARLGNRFFGE